MMGKGIFITGTDTGVGKTHVATGIALGLKRSGVDVGVMKPSETGCSSRAGRLMPGDACKLMRAADVRDSLDLVNPYRFKKPLAPSLAAELEGKRIDPGKIIAAYEKLSRRHDFMIVEGAGGIMVPLWQDYTYLDLARAFGLPAVIVARPGLGTINHTLLTISTLQHVGLTVSGVVVNYAQNTRVGLAEKTNPFVIEKISGIPVWDVISHGSHRFDSILARLR
jgi:dethiobiotin synthetase